MQSNNSILLRGELRDLPVFSHENHGRRFYGFALGVQRLSGAEDLLNVIAAEEVLERLDLSGGPVLEVTGQVRSFNNRQPEGRRLIISVYAEQVTAAWGDHLNQVELTGNICREPVCFDALLQKLFEDYGLSMTFEQHALVGSTVRSYLTWLTEAGRIAPQIDQNRLLWAKQD